ncbi:MAG TPA: hypothetical protein VI522_05590 [Gammaproteobacteria bacterium]|nr:hypothetical protein [Gammaproteobacteria bacterium]
MADPKTLANLHDAQAGLESLGLERAINKLANMDPSRVLALAIRSERDGFVQHATAQLIEDDKIARSDVPLAMANQSCATKYPTTKYWETQLSLQDAALRQTIESPTPDAMADLNPLAATIATVAVAQHQAAAVPGMDQSEKSGLSKATGSNIPTLTKGS